MSSLVLWNLAWSAALAVVVFILGRLPVFQRRPALMHLLWFGVLLRLVVPALITVPILPDTTATVRVEADFTNALPRNVSVEIVPVAETLTPVEPAQPVAASMASWTDALTLSRVLLLVSVAGTVVLLILSGLRCRWLHRIQKMSNPAPQPLDDLVARLADEMNLTAVPRLRVVDGLASPSLWGFGRRTTILLPRHLVDEFDADQWTCILAHELAHVLRGDVWFNLIAAGVLHVTWWNPIAWWAYREMRACQEASCDAIALAGTSPSRRQYAETLLQVVDSWTRPSLIQPHALLGFGNRSVLTRRFEMIADSSVRPKVAAAVMLCLAVMGMTYLCVPVRAEKEKPKDHPPQVAAADDPKEQPATILKYDDGKPDGKKSIAGTGEMIRFSLPDPSQKLKGIKLYCARYGYPKAPDEDVKIYLVSDEEGIVLHTELVPYKQFQRGESRWTAIDFKKPVEVTTEFWVIVDFNAEKTKGVYLSYDTSTEGKHSKVGLPGQESKNVTTGGDWMIQALLTKPSPDGKTSRRDKVNLLEPKDANPLQFALADDEKKTDAPLPSEKKIAEQKRASSKKLQKLMEVMYKYGEQHGQSFPPAVLYGKDNKGGKHPHSWRVALLPFLDQSDLYEQYKFDEPWDSPANKEILTKVPDIYRYPTADAKSTNSSYFVLVGELVDNDEQPSKLNTVFSSKSGMRIERISDGTEKTLCLVEAKRDIPWTKPEDIEYDPVAKLPKLGGYHEDGFHVGMADGSVRFLTKETKEAPIRAFISPASNDAVDF